ncbi:MAG: MFS transporter [Caldilineaceae bacterium]|nr:MFS transporter [Caldilineaceae bacterium]
MTKLFYGVLVNTVAASIVNTLVWFAVTFWVYLETKSVIATSVMAGIFTVTVAFSGFWLGSLVDRYPKKVAMMLSSVASLVLFTLALLVYNTAPPTEFTDAGSPWLWIFIVLTLVGGIVGNLRGIAVATLVTIMIPLGERDKANGLVGTATGVSFLVASILSGLAIGFLGVTGMLIGAIVALAVVIVHLWSLPIPHQPVEGHEGQPHTLDIQGSIQAIQAVPGLFGLIFFHTFNNFLGGVFMSLMDAYGLELVSVQTWGALWGFLSLGFIVGGLMVARRGLGRNPLQTLLYANVAMWTICIFFTIQSSIILLTVGMFIWLCLGPVVEAAEQTVLQRVIPLERQGRVFGFAQSVEQAASPITAFLIGPIAQLIFIPFMTTGSGVELIGDWFGTGRDRGMALLFIVAGVIGLIVTLFALRSQTYRILSERYQQPPEEEYRLATAQGEA